ncbi:hypothetical protein F4818DRAFT_349245 [Hypoxylon cercidicola]|nr:hypothetical protein F4818DRAFT_349245 [Hypoxylon cercidicola]
MSYEMDFSFLEFQFHLVQGSFGDFVTETFKARGEDLHSLWVDTRSHFRTMRRYFDHRRNSDVKDGEGDMTICKLSSGWEVTLSPRWARTTINIDGEDIEKLGTMSAKLLEFWARPIAWQTLYAIEVCIDSINDLEEMLSDWYKIARALVTMEVDRRGGMMSSDDSDGPCSYMIEPSTAQKLGLPACDASFRSAMIALIGSTRDITQHLESKSDVFGYSSSPSKVEETEDPRLSLEEHAQLMRLYTSFMGSEAYKADIPNLKVNFESGEFERMTRSRISFSKG